MFCFHCLNFFFQSVALAEAALKNAKEQLKAETKNQQSLLKSLNEVHRIIQCKCTCRIISPAGMWLYLLVCIQVICAYYLCPYVLTVVVIWPHPWQHSVHVAMHTFNVLIQWQWVLSFMFEYAFARTMERKFSTHIQSFFSIGWSAFEEEKGWSSWTSRVISTTSRPVESNCRRIDSCPAALPGRFIWTV